MQRRMMSPKVKSARRPRTKRRMRRLPRRLKVQKETRRKT